MQDPSRVPHSTCILGKLGLYSSISHQAIHHQDVCSFLLFHTLVSEGKDKSHGAVEPTRVGQNFAKQQGIRQRRCCLAAGAAVGGGAGLASLAGGDG
jgi:hypothetical protein